MKSKPGFSLIELIVVVAIVGVLVGMLLPAVQKTREAVNGAMCMANMQQIALALHVYLDQHQEFPLGATGLDGGYDGSGTQLTYSFFRQLAPYVEGAKFAKQSTTVWDDSIGDNVTVSWLASDGDAAVIKTYLCPSRRDGSRAKADYAMPDFSIFTWNIMAPAKFFRPPTLVLRMQNEEWNGLPSDGASNTLVLVHKGLDPEFYGRDISRGGLAWLDAAIMPAGEARFQDYVMNRDLDYDIQPYQQTLFGGSFLNETRAGMAFFQDKSGGHPVHFYENNNFARRAPCSDLFTSPHTFMPSIWCDGSVRRLAFTKDPYFHNWRPSADGMINVPTHGSFFGSREVEVIARLWHPFDGNPGVSDADTRE